MMPTTGPFMPVGLAGRAGAGKDTCADVLTHTHGFARIAFADAVRVELAHSFGVDIRLFIERTHKETPTNELRVSRCNEPLFIDLARALGYSGDTSLSPRLAMRLWATEFRRSHFGDDYWVRQAHETYEQAIRHGWRRVVFTDLRHLVEAAYLHQLGGEIWRVRRSSTDSVPATHDSEREVELILPDREICNEGSLTDLAGAAHTTYLTAKVLRASHEHFLGAAESQPATQPN
ncbi:Uncharacterised protein [Bordetella ansorpii]|uniref:Deoxynucleotide monophosphate kinase n=1 Tax=Bordetella ansorpii TaxID=288768 RepID=A0A157RMD5_9BORD|nr:hypothetical protein [Bordetella ansorpii]SAI59054.1 Uncharacterised protein [Bordetella ansorpii]